MVSRTVLPSLKKNLASIQAAAGPISLILTGLVMICMSWQKWSDPVVDFGLKSYVAWRLSEGDVLYRDMAYFLGPFSSYVHAILFKLFGAGIMVLAVFNMVLTAWLTGLIYTLFCRFSDRLTATVAGLAFLTVFAFAHYGWSGNFNFICSYSYELTQGVFLSLFAIHQLDGYLRGRRNSKLCFAGILTGLVFLTKIEVFVALFSALFLGWIGSFVSGQFSLRERLMQLGLFAVFFCLPPVAFLIYFAMHMPPEKAALAILQPWIYARNPGIRSLLYYRNVMGTDAIFSNFSKMVYYGASALLLVALACATNHWVKKLFDKYAVIPIALAALTLEICISVFPDISWTDLSRPLPIFIFAYGVYLVMLLRSQFSDPKLFFDTLSLFIFAVFSFVLLFKMILNVHVFHYGFALALPGALLVIKIVLHDIPIRVRRMSQYDVVYKALALTLVFCFFSAHIWFSYNMYRQKTDAIGSGADLVMDYPSPYGRGMALQTALDFIRHEMGENDTFITLPTAPTLNYLARNKIPLQHMEFNPVIWKLIGEVEYLQSLANNTPSYILLIDEDSSHFGFRYFGQDYGRSIIAWIMENYELVQQIGSPPFTGQGFGIQILKHVKK